MRLPMLLTAALLLAACQPSTPAPEAEAPATEQTQPEPLMPADAPPQEEAIAPTEASSTSCELERGSDAAVALASRCTRVSPATHPPCNPANPCQMIQDEIDRSCALWKRDGNPPAECAA